MTRTCLDDLDNDAEGEFSGQAPACIRKSSAYYMYLCESVCDIKLFLYIQSLSVLNYRALPMESSPTLLTTHLTIFWALWLLIPVTLGIFWTSL